MTTTDKKENQIFINIESSSEEEEYDEEAPEELDQITHNLVDELTELDAIEKVDLVTKEGEQAPKGSKAVGDIVTLVLCLLVTLTASAGTTTISNLGSTLESWLTCHERRKISFEIGVDKLEVTGVSDKEQQRLIDACISCHMQNV